MPGFLQSTRNLVASRVGGPPDETPGATNASNVVVKPSLGRRNTWTSSTNLRRSSRTTTASSSILESCEENTEFTSSTRSDSLYDDRSRRLLHRRRAEEEEERRRQASAAIRDRDETIASLERARIAEMKTLSEMRSAIDDMRREHRRELYWRDLDLDRLGRERDDLAGRLDRMTRDLWDEHLVRGIADLIKEGELGGGAGGGNGEDQVGRHVRGGFDDGGMGGIDNVSVMTDPFNYTSKLQSKLCKAMHRMEVLSNQMDLVQRSCDESLRSLRKELNDVVEGRCTAEVDLLSRLDALEVERRSSEEALRVKLECKERTIEELEDDLADLRDATEAADRDRRRVDGAGGSFEDDRRELESAREEILMLQASNKIKQRRIDQLLEERQQRRHSDGDDSMMYNDPVGSDPDGIDDDFAYSDLCLGPAEDTNVLSIVTRIARVTSHMEKDVKAGLVRRGEMLKSLKAEGDVGDDGRRRGGDAGGDGMSLADAARDHDRHARRRISEIHDDDDEEEGSERKMAWEEEQKEGSEGRSSSYGSGHANDEMMRRGSRARGAARASGPPMMLDIKLVRRGSL